MSYSYTLLKTYTVSGTDYDFYSFFKITPQHMSLRYVQAKPNGDVDPAAEVYLEAVIRNLAAGTGFSLSQQEVEDAALREFQHAMDFNDFAITGSGRLIYNGLDPVLDALRRVRDINNERAGEYLATPSDFDDVPTDPGIGPPGPMPEPIPEPTVERPKPVQINPSDLVRCYICLIFLNITKDFSRAHDVHDRICSKCYLDILPDFEAPKLVLKGSDAQLHINGRRIIGANNV